MSNLINIGISNSYKIKHFIESTSFCDIYTATNIKTSKLVSLSVYDASKISKDDLDSKNNLLEVGFLELGVEGLPKLIGFGDFNHKMVRYKYIATEFVSGESVLDRMKRLGPLSEYEATQVALKTTEIADNLHARDNPILLNGLSLDNILFDMSGESETIVLRNLINVRFFNDSFKLKYIDGVSVYSLATECFNDVFTPKTDQYNIGALLYQMLTGVPPFIQNNDFSIKNSEDIGDLINLRSTKIVTFPKQFDAHLKYIIIKTLHENSDERFMSLATLRLYLKREKKFNITTPKKDIESTGKRKTGNGFKDIAGMHSLKSQLKEQIIDVINRPEHFKKYGVTIPNGMLLYGPPGCGKTFISEKFCEEAGFNFFLIKPSDLSSIYVSGGEEKIGKLFAEAEKNAPTVICFDEVDAIMPKRTEDGNQSISARVNEFLAQINKCSERGLFVIATTNKPSLIDEAILRTGRIEIKIYVAPPDADAREKLFDIYLKNRYSEVHLEYKKFSTLTENYVASDIEFIVNQASHKAAMLDVRISNEIIFQVIESFEPSVSLDTIKKYDKNHRDFTNKKEPTKRNSIGFRTD